MKIEKLLGHCGLREVGPNRNVSHLFYITIHGLVWSISVKLQHNMILIHFKVSL